MKKKEINKSSTYNKIELDTEILIQLFEDEENLNESVVTSVS